MKTYNVYLADDLAKHQTQTCIEGQWWLARPIRYSSWLNRLKMCWLVLTDQADLVRWFKQ
jgi:hypothetical protein